MSKVKIPYDELWKDVLENLFSYFIKLIILDFYSDVDWTRSLDFLETDFSRRMFVYFYRIYDKFKKDVLSLAVFSDPSKTYKPGNERK